MVYVYHLLIVYMYYKNMNAINMNAININRNNYKENNLITIIK